IIFITTRNDASRYSNSMPFSHVFRNRFCSFSKRYTIDEIRFIVSILIFERSVYCKRKSSDRCPIRRVLHVHIFGQSTNPIKYVHFLSSFKRNKVLFCFLLDCEFLSKHHLHSINHRQAIVLWTSPQFHLLYKTLV